MSELPKGDPARQAELFQSAKDAAAVSPTTSNRLRYALALATPGHSGSDPVAAQRQLSELLARPETLLPAERLLALVELQEVDQRLVLQAENQRLRDRRRLAVIRMTSCRRSTTAWRRRSDENARLRKALDEARAKLDAVTHIERSINDRGTSAPPPAIMNIPGETRERLFERLPPHPFRSACSRVRATASQPQKRKARILVVDDDPGLLRLLTIRLRAENYEVEAVESAAAALAACTRFRPDLVITDLRMDQMDGIGLLKELQSRWPGLRGHHSHRARHHSRRGARDAERRVRLPHQAGRQAGSARSRAKGAQGVGIRARRTRTGAPTSSRAVS